MAHEVWSLNTMTDVLQPVWLTCGGATYWRCRSPGPWQPSVTRGCGTSGWTAALCRLLRERSHLWWFASAWGVPMHEAHDSSGFAIRVVLSLHISFAFSAVALLAPQAVTPCQPGCFKPGSCTWVHNGTSTLQTRITLKSLRTTERR